MLNETLSNSVFCSLDNEYGILEKVLSEYNKNIDFIETVTNDADMIEEIVCDRIEIEPHVNGTVVDSSVKEEFVNEHITKPLIEFLKDKDNIKIGNIELRMTIDGNTFKPVGNVVVSYLQE